MEAQYEFVEIAVAASSLTRVAMWLTSTGIMIAEHRKGHRSGLALRLWWITNLALTAVNLVIRVVLLDSSDEIVVIALTAVNFVASAVMTLHGIMPRERFNYHDVMLKESVAFPRHGSETLIQNGGSYGAVPTRAKLNRPAGVSTDFFIGGSSPAFEESLTILQAHHNSKKSAETMHFERDLGHLLARCIFNMSI